MEALIIDSMVEMKKLVDFEDPREWFSAIEARNIEFNGCRYEGMSERLVWAMGRKSRGSESVSHLVDFSG